MSFELTTKHSRISKVNLPKKLWNWSALNPVLLRRATHKLYWNSNESIKVVVKQIIILQLFSNFVILKFWLNNYGFLSDTMNVPLMAENGHLILIRPAEVVSLTSFLQGCLFDILNLIPTVFQPFWLILNVHLKNLKFFEILGLVSNCIIMTSWFKMPKRQPLNVNAAF